MKKRIFRYLLHVSLTFLILTLIGAAILYSENGAIHYADNPAMLDCDGDGPYVFYEEGSSVSVNYIKGDPENGMYTQINRYTASEAIPASVYFALDSSRFNFTISPDIETPPSVYADQEPIFAISDIESGYKAFRDMLICGGVINKNLKWTFGKGHLVLVGDFVDRGFSTTQVLWFIYKLEQEANAQGGRVHFILGNHEIKNLQENFESAAPKYWHIAGILELPLHELYSQKSYLGRWLSSKNTLELINRNLFTHGDIHPEVAQLGLSLEEMNQLVRENYY